MGWSRSFVLAWVMTGLWCTAVQSVELSGKVDAVTVYRGQALVTRLVDLDLPAGLHEVVVTDLPEHVVASSIHAESADGVEVRSVRYRVRPVQEDVREEVRVLDEAIHDLEDQLQENQRLRELNAERKGYLGKLEQFVAPTASVELTQGVLNAETLVQLSGFINEQRQAWMNEELRLERQQKQLNAELELRRRERAELTGSSSRIAREAVVFVNLEHNDKSRLRVRYLVDNASWAPSYNVRVGAERANVLIEYNASIQQMSGEDWGDVSMSLSTATPSLAAKVPVLEPLTISLQRQTQPQVDGKALVDIKGVREQLLRQQFDVNSARNNFTLNATQTQGAAPPAQGFTDLNTNGLFFAENDASLNFVAGQLQNLDLIAGGRPQKQPATRPSDDASITVTYQLASRTSLPSRSDRQLIQIASLPMSAEFYKVAIPVLTSEVYEEASMTNTSDMVLLTGPVMTYVAGQFVGHGNLPTVAIGEGFMVGLGVDSSLRSRRELADRHEQIQGGNRVVDFTYRVSIENFGENVSNVRLFDRLPQAKEADIKLSLVSTGEDLSDDPTYRKGDHSKGILRWEVEVPARAVGHQAKQIEYKFQLEYDKQMNLAGMPVAAR